MVKSGGSKSGHGSHHDSDEEEVTMPVFDANLPVDVKDGLEVACRYMEKHVDFNFRKLERSIATIIDRLPPPCGSHAGHDRRTPLEHRAYDAEDESPGLHSDGVVHHRLQRHPPRRGRANVERDATNVHHDRVAL
uniref:Uncharacterized protein n=1 Tax=Leersia perrieri TaxID=77586 RepID=A0A0D9XHJ4_9ORYZ